MEDKYVYKFRYLDDEDSLYLIWDNINQCHVWANREQFLTILDNNKKNPSNITLIFDSVDEAIEFKNNIGVSNNAKLVKLEDIINGKG